MNEARGTVSGGGGLVAADVGHRDGRLDLAHEPQFALDGLTFRPSICQLDAGGSTETVEPKVMQVLALLARCRGEVVSRDELVERCWGGRAVSEDAINRSVAKVRRISEKHGGFDLETIPRIGYRLSERSSGEGATPPRRTWLWAIAAALLLIATGAALWFTMLRPAPAEAEPVSLAVLPFRSLSAGDNYFAEGVAEEILTQLTRQPGLRVVGRTSSWMFRDQANLRDVGRRLDVAYVLEGSVRRTGDRVRVDVALVGTDDGMRRWSETFQGRVDDIFEIQSRIGSAVTGNLRREIVLTAPPSESLTTRGEVYSLYLSAKSLMRTRDSRNMRLATELLQRAVRLDAEYAPAWAALAVAVRVTSGPEIDVRRSRAVPLARRALALAPELAEAHTALGLLLEPAEGIRHLERAVALDPSDAESWLFLANARSRLGDQEGALQAMLRAADADPFWIRSNQAPQAAWDFGLRSEALRLERRIITRHPEPSHRELARARMAARQNDWSGFVLHARRAAALDSGDARNEALLYEELGLLRLGLASLEPRQPNPSPTYRLLLKLRAGEKPSLAEILDHVSPQHFWGNPFISAAIPRMLVDEGRPADLVFIYDQAFGSPEEMTAAELGHGLEALAPTLALALRDVGRGAEAERMLATVDRHARVALQRGRVPMSFHVHFARLRAVQGRRGAALAALQRAVAMGWPSGFRSADFWIPRPILSEDPAFRSLRHEPLLRRIDSATEANLARERRELLASAS